MRRIISIFLLILLLLSGCKIENGNTEYEEPNDNPDHAVSTRDLAEALISHCGRERDTLVFLNEVYGESISDYVLAFYGFYTEELEQCAIYRASAADDAFEISVFKLDEPAAANKVFENLEAYRLGRQGDFFGYNPAQEAVVADGAITLSEDGIWAAVLICPDAKGAVKEFYNLLDMDSTSVQLKTPEPTWESLPESEGEFPPYWLPYIDPAVDDMSLWDNSTVVAAIKRGNDEGLDQQGQMLFNKVNKVINSYTSDDMSTLEKEQAIYKWLCGNCEYDMRHYELINTAPRESYEPYGAIIEGKAVCLGFATAFQLFMDVLDIECITVVGAAFSSMEDHAWNMVKIDGEWYCVDTTWDEAMNPEFFRYFNVSSEYMALTDHQWDYVAYPIALPEETGAGMIHKLFNW